MAVYLDLVVILNFLVDFLLLIGTNRLCGYPMKPARAAISALLGGVYAGACMLPGFRFLGNTLWRLVSLGIMSITAFGWNGGTARRSVLFIFLSMALGGIALGLYLLLTIADAVADISTMIRNQPIASVPWWLQIATLGLALCRIAGFFLLWRQERPAPTEPTPE